MPGGDRTGPAGAGPMTGRSAGFCAGYGTPGYANPVPGLGRGAGRGPGRGRGFGAGRFFPFAAGFFGRGAGFGRGFFNTPYYGSPYTGESTAEPGFDPAAEKLYLEAEKKNLERSLDMLKKQIEQLGKDSGKSGTEE